MRTAPGAFQNETMGGLLDYFDPHVWAVLFALLGVAVVPFFLPPSVGMSAGLTLEEYILAVGALELCASLGVAAIVISHHDPEPEPSEWDHGW